MQSKLNINENRVVTFSFKKALINFTWAYIIVTILAYSISYLAAIMFKLPSLGGSPFDEPAFVMTVPYHLLINLLVWTFFGYLYFKKKQTNQYHLKEAMYLSCYWLVIAMIVDLVGFVLIKSPVSLTPYQFYVEYQPWISITYLIVFISPLIGYGIVKYKRVSLVNG